MWTETTDLGQWLPDQPKLSGPNLREAVNVVPRSRGYDPWPTAESANRGALDSFPRGALSGRTRQGTDFVAAGTTAKLHLATSGSFDDVTRTVGGAYATDKRWDFALFGEDLIATNYVDAPQRYQFGASTDFALLHADAPRAKHVAVVREFVVFGNLLGQGTHAAIYGTREDGVHWGGQGLANSWPTTGTSAARAVQSDWQPLVDDGGQITDLVGGADYGLVMKERSVWRMDYEGGDTFFRFVQVDGNVGCVIPGTSIRVGGVTYFISELGLRRTTGGPSEPFGVERVDRWLHERINPARYERVCGFIHPSLPVIGWAFMSNTATGDAMDEILLYNWAVDRFSHANGTFGWMVEALQAGASLDAAPYAAANFDTTYGATNMDSITGGVRRELSVFNAAHELATLTADPIGATLWTGDFEFTPGRVSLVRGVRPVYDQRGNTAVMTVYGRSTSAVNHTPSNFGSEDADGKFSGRKVARYHSALWTMFGQYDHVHALSADVVPMGMR